MQQNTKTQKHEHSKFLIRSRGKQQEIAYTRGIGYEISNFAAAPVGFLTVGSSLINVYCLAQTQQHFAKKSRNTLRNSKRNERSSTYTDTNKPANETLSVVASTKTSENKHLETYSRNVAYSDSSFASVVSWMFQNS